MFSVIVGGWDLLKRSLRLNKIWIWKEGNNVLQSQKLIQILKDGKVILVKLKPYLFGFSR